ncbi:hypothetical protein Tco_0214413 [Tanacetum coccineum]
MSIPSLRPCMCASAALLVCSSGGDVYPFQAYDRILVTTEHNYGVLGRYGVSVPALTKYHEGNKIQYAVSRRRQYAVFKLYGNKIFWKISNVVPTLRNPRYDWAQHEEAVVSYADLKAAIEGYYEENIDHMKQTDKVIDATMKSLGKNSIARGDLLNALNGVTEALKAIQDAVKENPTLYKKVIEATEAYKKNSNDLLTLIKNFDFQGLKSSVASPQATVTSQDKHLAELAKSSTSIACTIGSRMKAIELSLATIKFKVSSLRQDTSDIKSMMKEIYQANKCWGENVTQADIKEPPSHTEGDHVAMVEEPTNAVPITTVKPTKIPTLEVQPITTIISTSQPEPLVPQREGRGIVTDDQLEVQRKLVSASKEVQPYLMLNDLSLCNNGKFSSLTEEQIQAHMDKEEQITKAAEEAKIDKSGEVIQEKLRMPKHQVPQKSNSQKAKRSNEIRMKRVEQFTWRHLNFKSRYPFKFGDFGITKLDELGPIIEKKKNSIIKDLMTSLGKRYERLKKIHGELGIQFALHALVLGQAASQSSRRKRKHMEQDPKIKVPGFGLIGRLFIVEHPDQEKLQSKKVKLEALGDDVAPGEAKMRS